MIDPAPFLVALRGEPVTHAWRGYGSAIFLEFGALRERPRRDGTPGSPEGDLGLMI